MIFSNKIYKISSGSNPSLYAKNNNDLILTLFKNLTEKKEIVFSPSTKCLNTSDKFGYNKIIKLDNQFCLICFDKCVSIVNSLV